MNSSSLKCAVAAIPLENTTFLFLVGKLCRDLKVLSILLLRSWGLSRHLYTQAENNVLTVFSGSMDCIFCEFSLA